MLTDFPGVAKYLLEILIWKWYDMKIYKWCTHLIVEHTTFLLQLI